MWMLPDRGLGAKIDLGRLQVLGEEVLDMAHLPVVAGVVPAALGGVERDLARKGILQGERRFRWADVVVEPGIDQHRRLDPRGKIEAIEIGKLLPGLFATLRVEVEILVHLFIWIRMRPRGATPTAAYPIFAHDFGSVGSDTYPGTIDRPGYGPVI